METDEVSERYIAPCFVNGLETYDGEINLALDENLISNEYAVKLCLDYEVKKGNKVVKKELIVALKGELYFVKFIINPKEDDVEPEVIFRRSFMRLVNGIVDFGSGVITVYPEQDPFEDDSERTEKSMDDWDQLLDFNFDDIPQLGGEELSPFFSSYEKIRYLDGYLKTTIDVKTFVACECDGNHRKQYKQWNNMRKNNLKEIVLHDLTIFVASVTCLAAHAIAAAFNALAPALGTITPVIRAAGFAVITSKTKLLKTKVESDHLLKALLEHNDGLTDGYWQSLAGQPIGCQVTYDFIAQQNSNQRFVLVYQEFP
ncbi:hypothetical protein Tco_1420012 [Tanacetum coccineum]